MPKTSQLPAASSFEATDQIPVNQSGVTRRVTGAQISTFVGGGGGSDDQIASEVPFTPTGTIAATDVQAAIAELGTEKQVASANLTTYSGITPSANVQSILAAATYAAIRTLLEIPKIIASGASALNTAAIASEASNVTTISAPGVLTTDIIIATLNGTPIGVTGYVPSDAGTLYIYAYPTTDNVNFVVCNNTTGSITPGAITINWKVLR